MACDVSAYSLIGPSKALKELMNPGGSIMAMTYYGSSKALKGYNVMGSAKASTSPFETDLPLFIYAIQKIHID